VVDNVVGAELIQTEKSHCRKLKILDKVRMLIAVHAVSHIQYSTVQ